MTYEYPEISLEDFDAIGDDAKKYVSENQEPARFPISYLGRGRFQFRIWLDVDKRSGRPRALKRTFIQKFPNPGSDKGVYYVPNAEADKIVQQAIDTVSDRDARRKLYGYRSQQVGYVMAQIVSAAYDQYIEDRYALKPGQDVCLILRKDAVAALQSLLAEMGREQRAELLDTRHAAPPLELVLGEKNFCRVTVSNDKPYEMKPMRLPPGVNWEGLDAVYVTEDKIAPEEAVHELRKRVGQITLEHKQGNSSRLVDPSFTAPLPGNGSGRRESRSFESAPSWETNRDEIPFPPFETSQPAPDVDMETDDPLNPIKTLNGEKVRVCLLRNSFGSDPEMAKEWADFGYGNKPDAVLAQCLMCPNEAECERATAENRSKD